MASYVLDTNSLTFLKYKHLRLLGAVQRHDEDVIAVTTVNVDEYLTGWYSRYRKVRTAQQKATASSGLAEAILILRQFDIWPETETSLLQADRFVKSKLNIGKMDIRIATIALELDATVVTNNIRDFSRVPGLKVEDWSV